MAAILIATVLIAIIVTLVYLYFTWNFNYWKKRGVNGPQPQLLYGTAPSSITEKRNMIYDFDDHYKKYKSTENMIGGFSIRTPELIVLTPDLGKEVLISKFRNFSYNYFGHILDLKSEPILGLNPFLLNGPKWKEKRTEITPALSANRIKASYPVMEKVCTKMVDYVQSIIEANGKEYVFDCKNLSQRFTIQNVSDCVYGIDAEALELNKDNELLKQATDLTNGLIDGANSFFVFGSIPFLLKMFKKKLLKPETEKFFTSLMKDAIALRKTANKNERVDFLNYIIQLKEKKGLTDIQLQAHTTTFFLDGYDTSSAVLAHSILCMGRYRHVQDKLRLEIEKFSNEDGTISFDKLQEMPYLDQCINEVLRIFPPASFAHKICTENAELINSNGRIVEVEKGMSVIIPIYSFQNDEEYFPNPTEFDPARFSPENGGERKYREMGVYIPFGDGPRACLGIKFAVTQIKIALCELVRNFQITVNDKTRKDNLFDSKYFLPYLQGGIWCTFKELKK